MTPPSTDFSYTAHGKWIIAGEHHVVRGGTALLVPLRQYQLKLTYHQTDKPLSYFPSGQFNPDNVPFVISLIDSATKMLPVVPKRLTGTLEVNNQIPIGAGMGASAALCIVISKWFEWLGLLTADQLLNFARRLEDILHGKSSGADIAVILANKSIAFQINQPAEPLAIKWQPHWYLSFSGEYGLTQQCFAKINTLREASPSLAEEIDRHMGESVRLAKHALQQTPSNAALDELALSLTLGAECFEQWELISDNLKKTITSLKAAGAMACKPTGSGLGGHVISLWQTTPTAKQMEQLRLIPV